MSYDDLPPLEQFPDEKGHIPNTTTEIVHEGFGLLTAQDGDDLHLINVQIALGPDPQMGFVAICVDAQGARDIAEHLLLLAKYAELGVEAHRE